MALLRWRAIAAWPPRRWIVVGAAALAYVLAVGLPTDLVPNPLFGRAIPPTWWSWPALLVTALLAGLLAGTYVDVRGGVDAASAGGGTDADTRRGVAGGVLTFFAVGCPVCNKVVLLALGSSGALTWFEPAQPVLQLVAVGLLVWALETRLANEAACPVPASARAEA